MTRLLRFLNHPLVKWPAVTIMGLLALWMMGGHITATLAEQPIQREKERLASAFPPTSNSATATELIRLAQSLGLNLASQGNEPADNTPLAKVYEQLAAYVDTELARPNATVNAPPPEVQQFLRDHQSTLVALQQRLATPDPLVFQVDIAPELAGDMAEPLPQYIEFVKLQRLLMADILAKQAAGNSAAALAMAETAWQIHAAQQKNPLLIAQVASQINQRLIGGTLRKLPAVSPQWQTRLEAHNYQEALLSALSLEALFIYGVMARLPLGDMSAVDILDDSPPAVGQPSQGNLFLNLLSPLSGPYVRWMAIDSYRVNHEQIKQLKTAVVNVCADDITAVAATSPAFWNVLGNIANPSYENLMIRTQQLNLDTEFSQRILTLKAEFQGTNRWASEPSRQVSAVCPDFYWDYTLGSPNAPVLELEPQPPWQPQRLTEHQGLPLTFQF